MNTQYEEDGAAMRIVPTEAEIVSLRQEVERLRGLLARATRLERWTSIGGINSHAKLSPVSRQLWDEIQEVLRG